MFWLILMRVFHHTKRFVFSTQSYFFQYIQNLIYVTSVVLIFLSTIYWIKINTVENADQFEYSHTVNSRDLSLFFKMEKQAENFEMYRRLQALTIFVFILQTLKYLHFSKKMTKLLDTFNNAKYDNLFYIFVFSIVFFAFSVLAFFAFGVNNQSFNTIPKSIVQCILILLGNVDMSDLIDGDPIIGPIFYFLFCVSNIILYLKNKFYFSDHHGFDFITNVHCNFGWTLHRYRNG